MKRMGSDSGAARPLLLACLVLAARTVSGQDPDFAEPIPNITVVAGRDASLACVVSNLGTYKVAWIHLDKSTILAVHHAVITRNPRISISFNNHRGWILKIKDIRETDKGRYMCQINTEPVKTQVGYLTVVVPPNIIDAETSSEVNAMEDSKVTLKCRANGNPPPTITWTREDGENIRISKSKEAASVSGEVLEISRVSRLHMGAYLCIASNGIPPAVSKRVVLKVDFHPHLLISHQLVGAPLGYDATLECHIEAHPKSINYWAGEDGNMIFENDKFDIYYTEKGYSSDMHLKIRNLKREDYGVYKCIVKNPLGETDGQISLYESEAPPTISSASVTQLYGKSEDFTRNKNDNFSSYRNPSSLIVHNSDAAVRLNPSKILRNKTDDSSNDISPPRDWSSSRTHSDAAHGDGGRLKSTSAAASLGVAFILLAIVLRRPAEEMLL